MIKKFYLKLLMSLMLVALAVPQGKAETLDVAFGSVKNEYAPIYGWYADISSTISQVIYPENLVESMQGSTITGIKFYSSEGIKFYGGTIKITIGTTTNSNFPSAAELSISGTTSSVEFTPEQNANVIDLVFDEPFEYNSGSIIIQSTISAIATKAAHSNFDGIELENASYCNKKSTNPLSNFLPKTTFTYEAGAPKPTITANPTTLNINATVGETKTATFTVTGTDLTGDITVKASEGFTVSPTTISAADAANGATVTVSFTPSVAGSKTGTITLTSTGANPVEIALNGTATAPVTVNPENGYDFGNVLVNNTKVWTIKVTNNGTESVTPTLSGLDAPFSTNYTAAALASGQSANIAITFAPTEETNYSKTVTLSFPGAGDAIASYTYELTGKGVDSFEPTADNEVVKLITVDKQSIYAPNFIDEANGNTTPQQLNCYDMRFKMAQPDDPTKQIKARDLHPGNNLYEFYAIDDFGTEFRFATINLFAEGEPSSNPSVSAMDAPIKVTPSVEYYTEDGMPVHPDHTHYTTLNYTEKIYNDVNELVDLEGVIDYVNDTWSANTATNSHPDHYKFQIRGVGQFGDLVTSLTSEYVEGHMTGYGNSLVLPEGWERGSWVGPNNEIDGVHSYYYYDLYIRRSFFDERGITGPVTVVVNTTLSGSGFNADNYKAMSVNGVEQIIAKEAFKDYSWTVPLGNDIPTNTVVEQVPMGVTIRLVSTGADFNRTTGIYIYGGGTGVSNVKVENIYKSSMNVKAYTQKQVDEDTDRNLVAMKSGDTETTRADVNVLAYGDPAVTSYKLYENSSASTSGMTQVATATHNASSYTVSSVSEYNSTYPYVRDESLGNIDGMWLPMYPAESQKYFLPVTYANGIGDDGVVRSENNTYGSAMQQVQKNGSVDFSSSKCYQSDPWVWDGVSYAIYNPLVQLDGELPAATGYQLYKYRLWVDYDDNAPAWDFEIVNGKVNLTNMMDRPLYDGTSALIGGEGTQNGKDQWSFVAPADLDKVKLVARFYYKKTSTGKARPTDSDRLYYVVEKQEIVPLNSIITGIDNVSSKAVANVKYYNMMGVESNVPFQGANIEVTTYEDGSRTTRKIMK